MIPAPERIVFLDAKTFGDVSLEPFTARWNCTVHQVTGRSEVVERLDGRAVAVTNKVPIDRSILAAPETAALRLIAVAATGTDIIDRGAAAERGVKVCNVPGYATQSVAQFTIALILELATHAGTYGRRVREGDWEKSPVFSLVDLPVTELSGKKIGIVGLGNIGCKVASMAEALGMEVLVAARPGSNAPAPVGRVAIDELLRQADVVSLHCPLTPETKNLINAQSLSLMKPSAFLVNTARGALIDEPALIQALREKKIAAAALDAITSEPPTADHPIIKAAKELDNLLVTPHTGWSARAARERLMFEIAENIRCFFEGRPRNLVA